MPAKWDALVVPGSRVRISLHGRRIGGWVTADVPQAEVGIALKPISGWSGIGPPPHLIDLSRWAAWRWAGRRAHFLGTADPPRVVRALPVAPARGSPGPRSGEPPEEAVAALAAGRAVVRLPPAGDIVPWAAAVGRHGLERGGALVVVPGAARAAWLSRRLSELGLPVALLPDDWARAAAGGVVAVGTRSAAWAPLPRIGAAIVFDSHDEALREERAPTWEVSAVLAERCRRDGAPCLRVSPCPTLEDLEFGVQICVPRPQEIAGWPLVEVLDRRETDPRLGLLTPRVVDAVRSGQRVACIVNRKGRAGLLVCGACQAVAVCEKCAAAVTQDGDGWLHCVRCSTRRPMVCGACASARLKALRPGTARLAEHLAALIDEEVPELTAAGPERAVASTARVVVGTEAALHRAGRRDIVVFLDFDQELLAPRMRAAEQAFALLARSARLLRGRAGRLVVQTRQPGHQVIRAAVGADPSIYQEADRNQRQELGLPPFSAVAQVTGEAAAEFVSRLNGVSASGSENHWLLRASDTASLCDALAAVERPAGRLRVEVDPRRI